MRPIRELMNDITRRRQGDTSGFRSRPSPAFYSIVMRQCGVSLDGYRLAMDKPRPFRPQTRRRPWRRS